MTDIGPRELSPERLAEARQDIRLRLHPHPQYAASDKAVLETLLDVYCDLLAHIAFQAQQIRAMHDECGNHGTEEHNLQNVILKAQLAASLSGDLARELCHSGRAAEHELILCDDDHPFGVDARDSLTHLQNALAAAEAHLASAP